MQTTHWRLGSHIVLVLLLSIVATAGCGPSEGDNQENNTPVAGQSSGGQTTSPANPQPASSDPAHPVVKIATSLGDIRVRLDRQRAQLTVENFLQYANQKYYDGTIFHEVNPGYAVIGGLYTEDLARKPTGVPVRNEAHNRVKNVRGTIAMARDPDAMDSATSSFFINLTDSPHLDYRDETPAGYGYCVFGEVIEGMDVADRIGNVKLHKVTAEDGSPFERLPVEPVVIRSIRVED
ncbi:MAG: peptidylprolyl isomerase [Pirellulales bacterium]|nr:peptidylprolyl isomerase [Pirellulales bacterium]